MKISDYYSAASTMVPTISMTVVMAAGHLSGDYQSLLLTKQSLPECLKELGNIYYKKAVETNTILDAENVLNEFARSLAGQSQDLPSDAAKFISDNFWDLV